jgi:hypothetical protein
MPLSTDEINRAGIAAVAAKLTSMRWAFREQPTSDFGVDAQAEKLDENGSGRGKLIGLQIKTGKSYFRRRGDNWVYYGTARHLQYWSNHSLPIFIILHDPETDLTVWQRVERHLITEGEDGAWSIDVPGTNTLDAAHERFLLAGIASDHNSVRRYRLALDLPLIKQFEGQEIAYLRIEEWVNKTLSFRQTEVVFDENPEAPADLELDWYYPAYNVSEFMAEMFPWLTYSEHQIEDGLGGGEVDLHTLQVELSDIGRAALRLEEYYQEGAPEQDIEELMDPVAEWLDEQEPPPQD